MTGEGIPNEDGFYSNVTTLIDLDKMTENKINRFVPQSDKSDNFDDEEANGTELRKFSHHKTKAGFTEHSKDRTYSYRQSAGDTNFNIQSKGRKSNDIQHELGLHNNEVEDNPTAMRLTGLRKPLSIGT